MVLVTVVVLGDVGRSPRMQYHCASLVSQGYNVDVVGYEGSKPIKELTDNSKVRLNYIKDCPSFHASFPSLFAYVFKTIWQTITLLYALILKGRSDYLLVQTPPAIPTLFVCWLYCFVYRITFIIDWHNYAYKNMAFKLGDSNVLVKVSRWFEGYFGRKAHHSLCVTKAMAKDLKSRWNITATVLYDRAFESFCSVSLERKHLFFQKLSEKYPIFGSKNNATVFTTCLPNNMIALKQTRPALLVSSTSWTPDEDFSILLSALKLYDKSTINNLPDLICVITGKGPMKDYYIELISRTKWYRVTIITPWLETEDYPIMLASADLGVCMHTSTSGLDLPMKVVDMFGCGLPVVAHNFYALPELVKENENGAIFNDVLELGEKLQDWFTGFPNNMEKHSMFRKHIEQNFQTVKWQENWELNALPLFISKKLKKS